MPLATLKFLSPITKPVFEHLTKDLDRRGHHKLDNAKGTFMAVCVEKIGERHYSLAHYYEQNGDLMADPEMTFFKSADGEIYPCSFKQDNLGMYRVGLDITDEGVIEHENAYVQSDQTEFANTWLKNIADQQTLPFTFSDEDDR